MSDALIERKDGDFGSAIWTGDDPNQIGVFLRILKIEAVHEKERTISVHFILNIVWLNEELSDYFRRSARREFSRKEYEDDWRHYDKSGDPLSNVEISNASKLDGWEILEE